MKRTLFVSVCFLSILVSVSASAQQPQEITLPATHWSRVLEWLQGSFSSAEQAKADTDFFDIRLHVIPIWPYISSAHYLYVEQARGDMLDAPYRQRIYRIWQQDDSTIVSDVFTLPEPKRFAGAWKKMDFADSISPYGMLERLRPDSITVREGCSIYLRPSGDTAFVGSTREHECPSELRGAAFATSKVVLTRDYLQSWDQGFDSTGTQVWGATKGGYLFKRVGD